MTTVSVTAAAIASNVVAVGAAGVNMRVSCGRVSSATATGGGLATVSSEPPQALSSVVIAKARAESRSVD